jgi:hypothetical protein
MALRRLNEVFVHVALLLPFSLGDADLQDGTYVLKNVNSGNFLNLHAGDMTNGANVQTWDNPGSEDSQWRVRQNADSSAYTLQSVKSGKYLSIDSGSTDKGANVRVWSDPETPDSQWMINVASDGEAVAHTLENVGDGYFLNVAGGSESNGANVHVWDNPWSNHSQWVFQLVECHDAEQGEMCYNDTMWAKEAGVLAHPEWYLGLSAESSFAEFQARLHYCYFRHCPLPCAVTGEHNCTMVGSTCEDAAPGSSCRGAIDWAMEHGIHLNPQWYSGLDETSNARQFQERLFWGQESGQQHECPQPCCHDAQPGELCYVDAEWAQTVGINSPEFSSAYPPILTNTSDMAEFQTYLHLCYPKRCPEPCASTELILRRSSITLDCPDSDKLE